jgi:hypothetical protein
MVGNRAKVISSGALSAFAQVVYHNKRRLRSVWLVTPWLATATSGPDPISFLVEGIRGTKCSVNLITRTPTNDWHRKAVQILWANCRPTLFYCKSLHTKLYLLECDGFRCAIFGSPNFTARADNDNYELAIDFRTTVQSSDDDVAAIIATLSSYATNLTAEDDVKLIQQI